MLRYKKVILFLIIFIGVAIRLVKINIPLLETVATRQCETASIARNFYKDNLNIFYPKYDRFGDFNGNLIMELSILPYLAAIAYRIAGGVHEWLGRFISILFSVGIVFFIYKLIIC